MKRNTGFLAITASAIFSIAVGVAYFNTNAIGSDSAKLGFESPIAGLDLSFENYYKAGNSVSDKEQVDEVIEEAVRIDEEAKEIEKEYAQQLENAAKEEEALKGNEGESSDEENTKEETGEETGDSSDSDLKDESKEDSDENASAGETDEDKEADEPEKAPEPESEYKDVGISVADNYVNIRKEPNTECEILGKLYKGCAATILETKGEWVKIKSGSVTGYINSNYLAIGFDAEELVDKYATRYAEVTARTLNVRSKMSTDSKILTQIPKGEIYQVLKEYDEWLEVSIDDGDVTGYISKEYTKITVEFEEAISIEEEKEQLRREEEAKRAEAEQAAKLKKEQEEAAKKAAEEKKKKEEAAKREEEKKKQEAANKKPSSTKKPSSNKTESNKTENNKTEGNKTENNKSETSTNKNNSSADAKRQQVVNYALKFVGNRYVYGGTSLTNGTDCSGFTMSVYKAFGYNLPRTSRTQVSAGTRVAVSASTLKPGDLLFYCNSSGTINHVAMYIGNGKVVHASNPRSGIKVSKYNYRTPCAARRIIN